MNNSSILAARAALLAALCLFSLTSLAQAQSVPAPWSASDIGSPQIQGSSQFSNGTFTIEAAGEDIWNRSDQFHFVYRPVAGDVEIVARVDSFSAPHWWAKVGVMIRGSLAADAPHASALLSADSGIVFQRRTTDGAESASSAGPSVTSPYWVRLVRAGTQVTAYSSSDGARWELIQSLTMALGETAYVGVAVTSHDASALATAVVSNVRLTAASGSSPAPTLPAGMSSADVGAPAIAGNTSFADGTYTIRAGGTDIWDSSDQFHYAWAQMTGDVDVVARVASLEESDVWAKAGLMIRESLAANSRHAMAMTSADRGHAFQRRIDTGGWSEHTPAGDGTAPTWLRLVRSGSLFRAYRSADGSNWTMMGSDAIPMGTTVYVGIAVTSHNASRPTVAVVDNLRVGTGATDAGGIPTPDPVPVPDPVPTPDPTPVPPSTEAPPRAVAFLASADHDRLVNRYLLEIYPSSGTPGVSTPVATSDLGKPAPAANGEITVERAALFESLAPGSYIAAVTAVGDGGSSRSLTALFTR
jgi:regulation of enolase protein 1 (concanavalin A-like superfamily)